MLLFYSSKKKLTPTHTPHHSPFLKYKVGAFYQFCIFTADATIKHLEFASFLSFNHSRTLGKLLYQLAKEKKQRAQVS